MVTQEQINIDTLGRSTYNITHQVAQVIKQSGITTGFCQLFIHHTSASLILCENADPTVRSDLEGFMSRLVPDGDRHFEHTLEGPDDMAAHIRSILTKMDLSFPVTGGRPALGTWQGIYLCEHRDQGGARRLVATIQGE